MNDRLKRLKLPAFGFALGVFAGAASPCELAALEAEKAFDVPPGLLSAIGRVESGRFDAQEGRIIPWPWTIDVAGDGRHFDTAMEVVRTTQWLRDKGIANIDVGCFQVSLMHHPNAFETMEQAFDPPTNGRYAGKLLASLKARLGNWPDAVAAYHSADPVRGIPYRDKVYASLQGAPPVTAGAGVAEAPVPASPRQLPFGIQLWTPSSPGSAASVIHIGPDATRALPTVSSAVR